MSGMMDSIECDQDIKDAVAHTFSLINMGALTTEKVAAEAGTIEAELRQWARKWDSERKRIAASN